MPSPLARFVRKQKTEHWNVGLVDAPIARFLDSDFRPRVTWMPAPPVWAFYADPFGFERDGDLWVILEEYDHRVARGRLSVSRYRPASGFGEVLPILELPTHLAYPFLFEHDGALFCVPESHAGPTVELYRVDLNGGRLDRVGPLVEGFRAVDPTVFRHEGRWWLLCGDGSVRRDSHLCAFWAESPFGPWTPHAGNPVKVDAGTARPGGTPFVREGVLHRPAQDCRTAYGSAIALNRVLDLSPEAFREETVRMVTPDPASPYPHGLHTLSAAGPNRTLLDGVSRRLDPRVRAIRLGRRLKCLWCR